MHITAHSQNRQNDKWMSERDRLLFPVNRVAEEGELPHPILLLCRAVVLNSYNRDTVDNDHLFVYLHKRVIVVKESLHPKNAAVIRAKCASRRVSCQISRLA